MGFIYFSYGMTKSASSFVYQLQERIIELSSYELLKIPPEIRGNKSRENYVEPITDDKIREILDWLPPNAVTVIKTHGAASPLAKDLANDGRAFASATYRDPRDIAVSLIDHGRRSREQGLSDFAQFKSPLDSLTELQHQIRRLRSWLDIKDCLRIAYDKIRTSPEDIVDLVTSQVSIPQVSATKALSPFSDPQKIIHYNIGRSGRYKQIMSPGEIKIFDETFQDFIRFCTK